MGLPHHYLAPPFKMVGVLSMKKFIFNEYMEPFGRKNYKIKKQLSVVYP